MKYPELERLIEIVATLRGENGCQWDREQTHSSLRPNMLEEAYEAVDAINENNMAHLREELGDVLLQVVLHAQIAKDNNEFDIEDVAKELGMGLYKAACVCRINGKVADLRTALNEDCELEIVTFDDADGKYAFH